MKNTIWVVALSAVTLAGSTLAAPRHKAGANPEAAAPHVVPNSGILDTADLIAIAKLAEKGAQDQFSGDPSLKFVGREFTITLGTDELTSDYDRENLKLTVSTSKYQDGWELGRKVTSSEYVGQNSYGARATIIQRRGDIWAIEIPGSTFNRTPFTYQTTLDGSAARDLAKAIRVRITGTIKKADGVYAKENSIISDHGLVTDATVADPIDVFIHQWLIAADITKVEWFDSRTGAVLPSG